MNENLLTLFVDTIRSQNINFILDQTGQEVNMLN